MSVGVCNQMWPSRSIFESSLAGDLDLNSKYVITSRWYWHGKPISYPHCKAFRISQELLTNWKIILDQRAQPEQIENPTFTTRKQMLSF
jgi:hypothetical protein